MKVRAALGVRYGRVRVGHVDFSVEIDPVARAVVQWEEYELEDPI